VMSLCVAVLLALFARAAKAAETDLIWTDGRADSSGSYPLPSLLQESAPVGEPGTQAPVQPLPPTQPRGPVVLDMPSWFLPYGRNLVCPRMLVSRTSV
jgi:hypothetical protein